MKRLNIVLMTLLMLVVALQLAHLAAGVRACLQRDGVPVILPHRTMCAARQQ